MQALYKYGVALDDALPFLFEQRPSFEAFLHWLETFNSPTIPFVEQDVLSADDLDFWNRNGYFVLKEAVPLQQCIDAQQAIWSFLEASVNDRESWYRPHPKKSGLMLQFTQHEALQANRNSNRIRNAFRQLYGNNQIYKTIDKVSFNPPETDSFRFMGSKLHWDVSLALPIPFQLQGLLYLTDVGEHAGAFHCVPGFHLEIEDWLFNVPCFQDARELAPALLNAIAVPAQAGDFIIWHQALPHCATANKGELPRMVQYLTYLPEQTQTASTWV